MPGDLRNLSGNRGLPLRFDRDTILLGDGNVSTPQQIKMRAGRRWTNERTNVDRAAVEPNSDHAFLESLVKAGRRDAGVSVPALGSEGLAELRRISLLDANSLKRLGQVALAAGDATQARRLANEALSMDAADAEAEALFRSAERAGQPGARVPAMEFELMDVDDSDASAERRTIRTRMGASWTPWIGIGACSSKPCRAEVRTTIKETRGLWRKIPRE